MTSVLLHKCQKTFAKFAIV